MTLMLIRLLNLVQFVLIFSDLTDASCSAKYGLTIEDLQTLFRSWRIPVTEKYEGRIIVGESPFLIALKRSKYPSRLIDLAGEFGGSVNDISINIRYLLDYVDINLKKLIFHLS
jgi:hypothetical protein